MTAAITYRTGKNRDQLLAKADEIRKKLDGDISQEERNILLFELLILINKT